MSSSEDTPVTKILCEARAFLADRDNWCQGYAVHPDGQRRSLLGAVGHHFYKTESIDTTPAVEVLSRAMGRRSSHAAVFVQGFNDEHTHEEVLALLDRAIELSRQEPPPTPIGPMEQEMPLFPDDPV